MTPTHGAPAQRERGERFPPRAHIRTGAEFSRCFARGKRTGGRVFIAIHRPHDASDLDAGIAMARLGMAISRKVDKRAVERNRLRRLVREWFRRNLHALPPGDLVITGKPAARSAGASQVFSELDMLAARLGLMPSRRPGRMPGSAPPAPSGDTPRVSSP